MEPLYCLSMDTDSAAEIELPAAVTDVMVSGDVVVPAANTVLMQDNNINTESSMVTNIFLILVFLLISIFCLTI